MKFFVIVFSILVGYVCVEVNSRSVLVDDDDVKGFYWRDYENEIPEDAFPAGKDNKGNIIYIGQVLHAGFLIPGQINNVEKKLYFDYWHGEIISSENVKILCTRHPEQLQWIKTTEVEFDNLKGKRLILGGFQPSYITYLGRLRAEEDTSVGKLMVGKGRKELHVTKNGKAISYNSFEVLFYNPDTLVKPRSKGYTITTTTAEEDVPPEGTETEGVCGPPRIINIHID